MPIEEENIKGLLSKWGLASKPCDSCNSSSALLFCRPHSAFLCSACDSNLHSNSGDLHARVLICEVCEQSPAAFTCKADAASLCSSCDRDIHSANPLARRHHRLPVVPFFNSPPDLSGNVVVQPSPVDESWLIPNLQGKIVAADFLYSSDDVDSFVDSGSLNFSVVPSQTKPNHNHLNRFSIDNCFEIDFSAQCISQSISSSDVGIVPDGNSNSMSEVSDFAFSKPVDAKPVQLSRIDRAARVMRYREKRKNRKFQKTIRYASRKAYAEARPRIKGRFVKRENADAEFEQIYGSAVAGGGFLVDDDLYGVVPSF